MSLAETQRAIRDAIVSGEGATAGQFLVGGHQPVRRLVVHQRHFRASLARTLLTRYPALTWLVGGRAIAAAAEQYATACPPTAPCLAEYGEGFPAFVARRLGQEERSYVASFGELEWCVGAVSIGVDLPTSTGRLDLLDGDTLARATVTVQPGLRYVRADWPVHDLFQRFLTDSVPDSYDLPEVETWLEVRGARGEVAIDSVDAATWAFRRSLQRGVSLEQSCLCALSIDEGFNPTEAFAAAIAVGLVAGISVPREDVLR